MKCKELMVGDWIADNSGFPMRVKVVGDDYAYATFEGNEADPWEFDDKIEPPYPIPITEEILKKNGFTQEMGGYGKLSRSNDKNIYHIHIDFDRKVIEVYKSYPVRLASNLITLKVNNFCVHELQHALRLAGQSEMADNFKI